MKDLPSSFSSHSFISLRSISSTSISNSASENGPSSFRTPVKGVRKRKLSIIFTMWGSVICLSTRIGQAAEARRRKKKKKRRERIDRERGWRHGTIAEVLSLPHEFFPCFVTPSRRDTFQSRNLKLVNYLTIVVSRPPTFAVHPRLSVPDNRKGVFLHFPEIFRLTFARADRERMILENYWK